MLKSEWNCPVAVFGTAVILFLLMLQQTGEALAASPPQPGPPIPCISAALALTSTSQELACEVHNVGTATHNVTVDLRNGSNHSVNNLTFSIPPGSNGNVGSLFAVSCIVTTDEGTKDALGDLGVVLEAIDTASFQVQAATEGRIFNSCAPATAPPS